MTSCPSAATKQVIPLARELDDPLQMALAYGNVGQEALFTGDLSRARSAFNEQLRLCREHFFDFPAAIGLAGLAAIATRQRDPELAARLLGAATATGPWDADADVLAQLEQHFFAPARAAYSERRWGEAQAAGAGLSFAQAIEFALTSNRARS
jgi:hypothetical protein